MATRPKNQSTWFIQEWMTALGKIQADFTKELDWPKAKASRVWNRKQRFNEDLLLEVATWLNVRPYELLMHPADAMSLRQLQDAVAKLAVSNPQQAPAATPDLHRKAS